MRKLKELWDKIGVQFIKFGMVGVSNTVVSLATYYLFTFFGVHYLIANALGFVTGTLNAYYWNSKFVFKEEAKESGNKKESLVKTYISYGFSSFYGIGEDVNEVSCPQTRIVIRDDISTAALDVDDDRMGRPGNAADIFPIGLTAAGYGQFQEITPFFRR